MITYHFSWVQSITITQKTVINYDYPVSAWSMLDTDNLFLFNKLEYDIFDAGGPQCHFIMFVTTAVRIWTLSVH